ncbi:MAG: amidohydrolase family protein [Verrucomicrobiota bacterium]
MPVTDHHVHLYPEALNRDPAAWAAAHGEPHWAVLCCRRRKDGSPVQTFPSVAELLRAMDAAGVERAVLLGWYWQNPDNCTWQNRFYADCVRAHPDRLSAYATIHAGSPPALVSDELQRARDDGLSGLGELSPHSQGVGFGAAGFLQALDLAATWEWPVNLHVTEPLSRPYPGRVDTPLADFETLARRWFGVRFILAHWAGGLDVRSLPNVQVDTAAAPLIYGDQAWAMIGRTVNPDQVLFGSDHPLRLYPKDDPGDGWGRFVAEAKFHL